MYYNLIVKYLDTTSKAFHFWAQNRLEAERFAELVLALQVDTYGFELRSDLSERAIEEDEYTCEHESD